MMTKCIKHLYQNLYKIHIYIQTKKEKLSVCIHICLLSYLLFVVLYTFDSHIYLFISMDTSCRFTCYNVIMSLKVSLAAFTTQFIRSYNVPIILNNIAKLLNRNHSRTFFLFRLINRGTKIYTATCIHIRKRKNVSFRYIKR